MRSIIHQTIRLSVLQIFTAELYQAYSNYLRAFYEKLKAKKGSGKAIVAIAKKLLGIIYLTLKKKWGV